MFPNLNLTIKAKSFEEYWAVVGPSSSGTTTFLEVVSGRHLCVPPLARTYPDLAEPLERTASYRVNAQGIQYVGFNTKGIPLGGSETKGAYLSARYESRREDTDFSLLDYLTGNTALNPYDKPSIGTVEMNRGKILRRVIGALDLENLLTMPVSNLSNGQTRRALIAKAVISRPKLLLLDEPFLGLDPMTRASLSPLIWWLSRRDQGPTIVLALKDQEGVPSWVTHVVYLGQTRKVEAIGPKYLVREALQKRKLKINLKLERAHYIKRAAEERKLHGGIFSVTQESDKDMNSGEVDVSMTAQRTRSGLLSSRWYSTNDVLPAEKETENAVREPLIEFRGVNLRYGGAGGRTILGDWNQDVCGEFKPGLWWTVRRGDRWGLFGPNGSGKTTLLSLISSDHPQAYSLPIQFFGRSRLPSSSQPGLSMFDIQARIGQASPEIHNFFPRSLSLRQTVENAWADSFLSKASLNHENDLAVDAALRWFRRELDPSFSGPDPVDSLTSRVYHDLDPTVILKAKGGIRDALNKYREDELDWADNIRFRDIPFSSQRVALFLRAIVKKPNLVILDEAFGGMDEPARIKCMMYLTYGETKWLRPLKKLGAGNTMSDRGKYQTMHDKHGEPTVKGLEPRQALISVSHRKEEVPPILDQWLCLPQSGASASQPPRFGSTPFKTTDAWKKTFWWKDIWQS